MTRLWRHVILSTRSTWLHGDPRGFRSRGHRIHSSGDYKNPPPEGEHAGLYRYHKERSMPAVIVRRLRDREVIVREVVRKLRSEGLHVIAVSMSATHLHVLSETPYAKREAQKLMGRCKQAASVRISIPGRVWGEGGSFDVIRDKAHLVNTYDYIREKQDAGTVVWSHRDTENWIDFDVPVKVMK